MEFLSEILRLAAYVGKVVLSIIWFFTTPL